MTLARCRIVKGAPPTSPTARTPVALARRVPREVVEAKAEARRIVEEAQAEALAMRDRVAADAAETARAELAAEFAAVATERSAALDRAREDVLSLARILAERLVGEALAVAPARIATLLEEAVAEARGARQLRIEACPEDATTVAALLGELDASAVAVEAPDLTRGSLRVRTELGNVDARLEVRLDRLTNALRGALAETKKGTP